MNSRKTILTVEDTPNLRRLIAYVLSRAGYQVVQAGDGEEAVEALKKHRPDLILLDVRMPRMDGFELLELIRGFPSAASIPVVMLTSLSGPREMDRALSLGVVDYLVKPLEPKTLLSKVRAVLAN